MLVTLVAACGGPRGSSTDPSIVAGELRAHVEWLASDALGGRRAGTPEADRAARYLANEFKRYGLTPLGDDGDYLQAFSFVAGVELGSGNRMQAVGDSVGFTVGTDWRPLAFSGNGGGDYEVVFAGYGISAPDEGYDDYADLDVRGKAVLVIPYGPPAEEGGMRFPFQQALRNKVVTAREKGAAAVLIAPHPEYDPPEYLEPLRYDASPTSVGIVAVTVTRATAEALLGAGPDLEQRQRAIDETGEPSSAAVGSGVTLAVEVRQVEGTGYNVLGGVQAAGEGAPWVMIGAHYDHLGMGGAGSLAPDTVVVHNGADDNASGSAALLELAQAFAADPPAERNLIFAAFSAEELGLLGSSYLAANLPDAVTPLETMINMDMVGRLNDARELTVYGTGTSPSWDALLDEVNANEAFRFKMSRIPDGYGPSDHSSFYAMRLPVLHFFTGTHGDYHRPSDDPETLNYAGEETVARFIQGLVGSLGRSTAVLAYQTVAVPQSREGGRANLTVYTGVIPDFAYQGKGFRLSGVNEGSPAAMAGIEGGDIVLRMGSRTINDIYDYTYALQEGSPGQRVELEVKRGDRVFTVQIVLGSRRRR